ncbi:hypothetical protein D3C79_943240 [compost metagenome]
MLFVHGGQHRTVTRDSAGLGGASHQHQATDLGAVGVVVDLADQQPAQGRGTAIGLRIVDLGIKQRHADIGRNSAETYAHCALLPRAGLD